MLSTELLWTTPLLRLYRYRINVATTLALWLKGKSWTPVDAEPRACHRNAAWTGRTSVRIRFDILLVALILAFDLAMFWLILPTAFAR